jgi:hypothetical protein
MVKTINANSFQIVFKISWNLHRLGEKNINEFKTDI